MQKMGKADGHFKVYKKVQFGPYIFQFLYLVPLTFEIPNLVKIFIFIF